MADVAKPATPQQRYQQQPFPEPTGDLAHIRAYARGNGYEYSSRQEDLAMLNYAGWRLDPERPTGYQMVWADDTRFAINATAEADETYLLSRVAPELRDRITINRVAFDRAEMLRLSDVLSQTMAGMGDIDAVWEFDYKTGRFAVTVVGEEVAENLRQQMPEDLSRATDITLGEGPLTILV